MAEMKPVRWATAGLTGYGATILNLLLEQHRGEVESPAAQLAAVLALSRDDDPEMAARLDALHIPIFTDFEQLLDEGDFEAIWLPLPIDLHRPMTERALAAGKAVMCEKPVAGCIDDVDAMIDAERVAGLPVTIGYQDIYRPSTLTLKRKLLEGAIGRITSASVWACWPRGQKYYTRNQWAGRFKSPRGWIMDSPANNAVSHYINLPLFLLGDALPESATPSAVEAELYRGNPTENFDTIAARATLPGDVPLVLLLTHACAELHHPCVVIEGDAGKLTVEWNRSTLETASGAEVFDREPDMRHEMVRRVSENIRGIDSDRVALATLHNARPQQVLVSGAAEAADIHDIDDDHTTVTDLKGQGEIRAIDGIAELFRQCAQRGQLPGETDLAPWTVKAESKDLHGYQHFAGPKAAEARK